MPLTIHNQTILSVVVLAVDAAMAWAILFSLSHARRGHSCHLSAGSLAVLLALAVAVLVVSPHTASDLSVSDTIEYSSAAHRLWYEGTYSLGLAGQAWPPRYPPFFSAFLVMPGYMLGGSELGNGIVLIAVLAVMGVLAAFLIGARLGGAPAGIAAGAILLLIPEYRNLSHTIWIDVPITTIALLTVLNALEFGKSLSQNRLLLSTGILIGLAVGMRSTCIILLVPFIWPLWQMRTKLRPLGLLCGPSIVTGLSTLAYNSKVFSSPWRSGYHYWVSIPYDFPGLTFSLRYLSSNIELILSTASFVPGALFLFVGFGLLRHRELPQLEMSEWRKLVGWTMIFGALLALFFLPYFYCSRRFFLPFSALTVIAGVVYLTSAATSERFKAWLDSALLLALALVVAGRILATPQTAHRDIAEQLAQLPKDVVIVSAMNPAYLERLVLAGTNRQFVPLSREVEFASKVVAPESLAGHMQAPVDWKPHRSQAVLTAGARDVYEWTALEQPEKVADMLRAGRCVFLEARFASSAEIEAFRQHFSLTSVGGDLFGLALTSN
ncbi:MAG: glycosyltransferase family 39 protein [Oligoflexia bacterium]|nr:glycosyltransferase family 39 protein [Oligoflexia bacterium]